MVTDEEEINEAADEVHDLLMVGDDAAFAGAVMTVVMARLLVLVPPETRGSAMRAHTAMALQMASLCDEAKGNGGKDGAGI